MFNTILVPVNLSDPEFAKPALTAATALARGFTARLHLIHVVPVTPVMLTEFVPADYEAQQRQSAEEALAIVAAETSLGADRVSTRVREGGIYDEILAEAAAIKADLIVMSSHQPAMKTYLLG